MLKADFASQKQHGFRLEKARDHFVSGKYIEKYELQEIIKDPFGAVSTYTKTVFDVYKFTLSDEFPGLEIVDSPRRHTSLLTRISELSGFKISFSPLTINLFSLIEFLEKKLNKLTLVQISCSGINLSPHCSAKIIVSGNEDVMEPLQNIKGDRQATVDSVNIRFEINNQHLECELYRTGIAKIQEGQEKENFLVFLREGLKNSTI
jgi:hypothetical protein